MSKRNSAPTYMWVFMSNFTRWITLLFVIQWLATGVFLYGIKYHLDRSCYNTYERSEVVAGYTFDVNVGRDVEACNDAV